MQLLVKRTTKTSKSTIGDFYMDGNHFAYSLEDVDRGLTSNMSPEEIADIKIHGQTAIPTGKYNVVKYFSSKHGKDVLLLENVPGFTAVEIHVGNKPEDTDGCLLLGSSKSTDWVSGSTPVINALYAQAFAVLAHGGKVEITYE